MNAIRVLHITDLNDYDGEYVYIGRQKHIVGGPSPLGNPFSYLSISAAQFKVKDRDEAVDKYADWLTQQLKERNVAVVNEMNRIYKLAKEGNVNLVCHCAPQRCHGDIIKSVIEGVMKKRNTLK